MSQEIPLPPPNGTIRKRLIDDECNFRGTEDVWAWDETGLRAHEANVRAALQPPPDKVLDAMENELRNPNNYPTLVLIADALAALRRELAAAQREIEALKKTERRFKDMLPIFEEARDALPAISDVAARLYNVRLDLADRMDSVSRPERWNAIDAARGKK